MARIPLEAEPEFRQSTRGDRYREALGTLAELGALTHRAGAPHLDLRAADELISTSGQDPSTLVAASMVNARTPPTPAQPLVPLVRRDGRALWHLASVVDDIDQNTTFIVRGTDKANATSIQVRLHWLLKGGRPPAHLFLPKLIEQDRESSRIARLLSEGIRPSALRWFLTEPYLEPGTNTPPHTFTDLVSRIRRTLPKHSDSRFDYRRLQAVDRKTSAALPVGVATQELRSYGVPGGEPVISLICERFRRPIVEQVRLCHALTRPEVAFDPPPTRSEEAWWWLDAWLRGTAKGPPPDQVRWVLTGQRNGPRATELLEVMPPRLMAHRLASARQALSRSKAA